MNLGLEGFISDHISEMMYRQQEWMDLVNLKTRYDEAVDSFNPNYPADMTTAYLLLDYFAETVIGTKTLLSSKEVWSASTQEELFKIMFHGGKPTCYFIKNDKIGVIGSSGATPLKKSGYMDKGKVATLFVAAKQALMVEMDVRDQLKKDEELTAKNRLTRNMLVWMGNNLVAVRRLFCRNILYLINHASGKLSNEFLCTVDKEYHLSNEALSVDTKRSIDYTAEFKQSVGGKLIDTRVRIVTHGAIITPDTFDTYTKVMSNLSTYVKQILDKHNSSEEAQAYGSASAAQIDYMGIHIVGKVKGKDCFNIALGIKGQEHLITGEFLGTEIVYMTYDG